MFSESKVSDVNFHGLISAQLFRSGSTFSTRVKLMKRNFHVHGRTKTAERLRYENRKGKKIYPKLILLTVDNYFRVFNTVSYCINLYQEAAFTQSFWEASWWPKLARGLMRKTTRGMVVLLFPSFPLFLFPSGFTHLLFGLLKIYCLSVLTDDVFIGSNEVPAVSNNNRTFPFLRYITCFP